MPIFDFRCADCGKTSELLVRGASQPVCPACGSALLEKQVSMPAPAGQSKEMIQRARKAASSEGHFSHYKASERPR